jgi:hypothetical protein
MSSQRNGVIMNNKPNEKKSLGNAKTLTTYLYVNKNRFTPKHQKTFNIYFDADTFANELQWSRRKVYRVLDNCIERKFIQCVSDKYCNYPNTHISRLFNINLISFEPYLDKHIIETETDRFINRKLNVCSDVLLFPNNCVFFENFNYGKTFRKSIDFIHTSLKHFLIAKNEITFTNDIQTDLTAKINETNKTNCEYISFREKINISKPRKLYKIKKSIRAVSYYCNSTKYLRTEINKRLNLNNEYDIPAAVPTLFRLLNKNEFNLDENIRQIILDKTDLNNVINELDLKPIFFRFMFSPTYEKSYANAVRAVHFNKVPMNLLSYWKILWDATHELIGDTSMRSEIFKYESILELRTVLALREQGFYTSNVYDCFYSEANPDIIKNELVKQSKILYNDYQNKII